jgi:hypothetical protein
MAWLCAHTGDVHIDEDHYFGDTAQCLEWFVADASGQKVDLFVINGDLTTFKATIKERILLRRQRERERWRTGCAWHPA